MNLSCLLLTSKLKIMSLAEHSRHCAVAYVKLELSLRSILHINKQYQCYVKDKEKLSSNTSIQSMIFIC